MAKFRFDQWSRRHGRQQQRHIASNAWWRVYSPFQGPAWSCRCLKPLQMGVFIWAVPTVLKDSKGSQLGFFFREVGSLFLERSHQFTQHSLVSRFVSDPSVTALVVPSISENALRETFWDALSGSFGYANDRCWRVAPTPRN